MTTAFSTNWDVARAVALQSDGKIVAAGESLTGSSFDFALARYNADGSLDTSFGSGGKVTTDFASNFDTALAVTVQSDGKILAAGERSDGSHFDFALARYNADGSLDSSFGSGGKVTDSIGPGSDAIQDIALQPDGKIVVAGFSTAAATSDDFALARYNANGTLDTSFGSGGHVVTVFDTDYDDAYAVLLQPDGKIAAVGAAGNATGTQYFFALARYNADGSPDSSFGSGGKVTTAIGSKDDEAFAGALQPDGKIVAGGYMRGSSGSQRLFALVRYNGNGSLDATFGSGGNVTASIGTYDYVDGLALQPDGKIVAAGIVSPSGVSGDSDFGVARYNADGSLDPTFGSGGFVTISFGSTSQVGQAMALQPNGKIVVVGDVNNGSTMAPDLDFAVARVLGSTLTVAKTGTGSGTVTSSPAGLDCGSTCSAPFAAVSVTLIATPAKGSYLAGWSGDCSGKGKCTLTMSADHAVTARFQPQCVVPKVKGKKLAAAKRAIKKANCSVGRVTKAFSAKVKKGRVISQKPAPGKKLPYHAKVKLKVSKGPRS